MRSRRQVIAGKHVWHRKNCINCHTLLGEGAYYAPGPDQDHAAARRRLPAAFLKDPSKFYSEERDRRLMPNLQLSDQEINEVIAFLGWVSKIDNQGWPPRPILVSAALPGTGANVRPRTPRRRPGRPTGKPSSGDAAGLLRLPLDAPRA